ncbi:MAG: hypothetical protein WKG06_38105 [Segetibacter sp.]
MENDKVVAVNDAGQTDKSVKVFDFSLTRNVVQMFIAVILLILLNDKHCEEIQRKRN